MDGAHHAKHDDDNLTIFWDQIMNHSNQIIYIIRRVRNQVYTTWDGRHCAFEKVTNHLQ